jgi:spermidine synthase
MFNSNALQTLLYKKAPHTKGLRYVEAMAIMARALPGHCCILGLGGGGAVHHLAHKMDKYPLTVVELDEEVIQIAKQFFMIDQINNLTIIHAEASAFMKESQQSFDHILIDVFDAHQFPDSCNNADFFSQCQKRLTPEGILAINIANKRDHRPLYELVSQQFSSATLTISIKKRENIIVFASNSKNMKTLLSVISTHKKIKSLTWNATWGCVAEI